MAIGTPTLIGTATGSAGATLAITVPVGGVPAGALIIVLVCEASATIGGSVADTAVNSYTAQTGIVNGNSSAFGRMFYAPNASALVSGNSITYTRQTSADNCAVTAFYVTGAATSTPLDTAVTASTTGLSTSPSITSGTPSQSGELFVGMLASSSNITYTQDTTHSWATPPNLAARNGAAIGGGSQINAGAGTIVFAPTITNSNWIAAVYGFTAAASDTLMAQASM